MPRTIIVGLLTVFSPAALALSPDYLAGEWCYSHYEASGEREEQNLNYVFAKDGTLQYQNSEYSDQLKPGTYQFEDGILRIKPAFMLFKFRVAEQSQDQLVLDSLGRHVFLRGACT
jgi:hypothetical protein